MQEQIVRVRSRIAKAAQKAGIKSGDITLVAVSKTVGFDKVKVAYDMGITDFGENRTQDLHNKWQRLPEARWHMIGRLQTNKVKDVVGQAFLIHSLDRWKLAEALDQRGQFLDIKVPALLQVNIAQEEQKAGVDVDEVQEFLSSAGQLKAVRICGLMTIAPLTEDAEQVRPVFRELSVLRRNMQKMRFDNVDLQYLSMGMSQDFEVAIEEGANMVRIGSAIFS